MNRTPRRYRISLHLSGGQSEVVHFTSLEQFQDWYQGKMAALGYSRVQEFKTHSFRIGGATKMAFLEVSPMQLQIMGRWASDIYMIYARQCKGKLISLHHLLTKSINEEDFEAPDEQFNLLAATQEDYPDSDGD